jgi:hypothetical protein
VGNLWRQPINGGAHTQLTTFAAEETFDFAMSRSGQLAISRGSSLSDADREFPVIFI